MKIKKDNLLLRSATIDDARILNKWWNDGTVMAHAGFPHGTGESLEYTENLVKQNETLLSQRLIIEIDDKRVGEMMFGLYTDDEAHERVSEMGIKICEPEYQNHGYGTTLLKMLITYLFTDAELNSKFKIDKIVLDTNTNNKRAQKVYEQKLGFRTLGTEPSWVDENGVQQYQIMYDMTREAFGKLNYQL